MKTGLLRERIEILKFVPEPSAVNQQTKGTYEPLAKCWAQVLSTQSAEQDFGGGVFYTSVYKFYIRRRDGIDPSMRIRWKGRIFQITAPPIDWKDERTGLTLICREVT